MVISVNYYQCHVFQGHDTTAAAVNWAIHLIGSHPEVQEKLHQEMDQLFGENLKDNEFDSILIHAHLLSNEGSDLSTNK